MYVQCFSLRGITSSCCLFFFFFFFVWNSIALLIQQSRIQWNYWSGKFSVSQTLFFLASVYTEISVFGYRCVTKRIKKNKSDETFSLPSKINNNLSANSDLVVRHFVVKGISACSLFFCPNQPCFWHKSLHNSPSPQGLGTVHII